MNITRDDVLEYHRRDRPGKLQVEPTKPLLTQRDLSLAYTPGVAHAVEALDEDSLLAYEYTAKGNLVAVVSNGSAILGLGNRGPIPAKPVMEGKALLFKRLADVDVFDLELDARTADEIVAAVSAVAPGFGGINLEDIAAPVCFEVEERLRALLSIPVFHDDQHGTAIITGAALLNASALTGKGIEEMSVVVVGAGAAGVACAEMYVQLGVRRERITMFDRCGLVYEGRTEEMDPYKGRFARPGSLTPAGRRPISLAEALQDADVLLGVSVANIVTPDMLRGMAPDPILFLLANPDPEIPYDLAVATRPDAIVATGRSDYPNQVNNVLGFPFVFRGALDARATSIDEGMKMAAARALAALAREDVPETVLQAYGLPRLQFGRDYIIPKPNDHRVLEWVTPSVAEAAMRSGAARRSIDLEAYRQRLESMQGRGWRIIHAITEKAQRDPRRLVFAEGTDPHILRAARQIQLEGTAEPVLLGDPEVIQRKTEELGLHFRPAVQPLNDPELLERFTDEIHTLRQRKGITRPHACEMAKTPNAFGMMMVRLGLADAFLSGLGYEYIAVLRPALQLIGTRPGVRSVAGVFIVVVRERLYLIADGLVNIHPDAETMAETAVLTADFACQLDLEPRIAMLSFSNFGSVRHPDAEMVRRATEIVRARRPDLCVDGEVQVDIALSRERMDERYPFSRIRDANVLIFPNLDASNAAFKLLQHFGEAEVIGPLMLGMGHSVHALQPASDVTGIVRMAALAVVDAQWLSASHC
jgi:malate dehydrogenase (oxaloacetate-decarboxylating)(NADP+)